MLGLPGMRGERPGGWLDPVDRPIGRQLTRWLRYRMAIWQERLTSAAPIAAVFHPKSSKSSGKPVRQQPIALRLQPMDRRHQVLARLLDGSTAEPVAHASLLLHRHGSLAAIFDSTFAELLRDVPQEAVERILASREVQLCSLLDQVPDRPILKSGSALNAYLRVRLAHLGTERVRMLFLDKAGRMIADELVCNGTIDESAIFPRALVKRAVELDASAMILSHNHPSQDPTPSSADIRMTHQLQRAAQSLDIVLTDHVIVGKTNFSMRDAGLLG